MDFFGSHWTIESKLNSGLVQHKLVGPHPTATATILLPKMDHPQSSFD